MEVMKDKNGSEITVNCLLYSELSGRGETKITYKGGDLFGIPGGGIMTHTQESLLASHWVLHSTPKEEKQI